MKKIPIKQVIIFVVTLFILLYSTYYFCNIAIKESKTTKIVKKNNKLSDKEREYRKKNILKNYLALPKNLLIKELFMPK